FEKLIRSTNGEPHARRGLEGFSMSAELRAKRYRELCREAAKQLGCKASDELAVHVATLRLCRETFAARLIAGRDVDPAALLRLDESLREFMRQFAPAKQHTVKFEYVESVPAEQSESLKSRLETHRPENALHDLPKPGKQHPVSAALN